MLKKAIGAHRPGYKAPPPHMGGGKQQLLSNTQATQVATPHKDEERPPQTTTAATGDHIHSGLTCGDKQPLLGPALTA